jgi:hypothetical protein
VQNKERKIFMVKSKAGILMLLAILLSAIRSEAQEQRRLINSAKMPVNASSINSFVPDSWRIEKQVNGDLNGDSVSDVVLQLLEKDEANKEELFRALIVLLKRADGKYLRITVARSLLAEYSSGGMKCGSQGQNIEVKIDKGVFDVDQCLGGASLITFKHRFRYDKSLNRVVLIGLDSENGSGGLEVKSVNYLTGLSITKTAISDNPVRWKTKREKVSTKQLFIEDIDSDSEKFWH